MAGHPKSRWEECSSPSKTGTAAASASAATSLATVLPSGAPRPSMRSSWCADGREGSSDERFGQFEGVSGGAVRRHVGRERPRPAGALEEHAAAGFLDEA